MKANKKETPILKAQNALTRQAEAMEGRKTIHPGPTTLTIRKECTLELTGIEEGSTILDFGIAQHQRVIEFPDTTTFGTEAVAEVASAIKSLGNANKKDIDPGVLQGLYGLGNLVQPKHITSIEWISPKHGKTKKVVAAVNKTVKHRIANRMSRPRHAQATVDGVLYMAAFKDQDMKCQIEPAMGAPVTCSFGEDKADRVQNLLRHPVRAVGLATYPPYSDRIECLQIESLEPLPSLNLGEGDFFKPRSILELAASQKVKPIRDIGALSGVFEEGDDVDAFLEDIYASRK
jgi:hypothetical protein